MPKTKQQRKFDKLMNKLCNVSNVLGYASMDAEKRGDENEAWIYGEAQYLLIATIDLVDPGCNPRYIVEVKKRKDIKR